MTRTECDSIKIVTNTKVFKYCSGRRACWVNNNTDESEEVRGYARLYENEENNRKTKINNPNTRAKGNTNNSLTMTCRYTYIVSIMSQNRKQIVTMPEGMSWSLAPEIYVNGPLKGLRNWKYHITCSASCKSPSCISFSRSVLHEYIIMKNALGCPCAYLICIAGFRPIHLLQFSGVRVVSNSIRYKIAPLQKNAHKIRTCTYVHCLLQLPSQVTRLKRNSSNSQEWIKKTGNWKEWKSGWAEIGRAGLDEWRECVSVKITLGKVPLTPGGIFIASRRSGWRTDAKGNLSCPLSKLGTT